MNDNLPHCNTVDDYEKIGRIQEGSYGIVYKAKNKKTEEIVALKRIKLDKHQEGFPLSSVREINLLLKSNHKNIVKVNEIVTGSNIETVFMVMEYVDNDIRTLLTKNTLEISLVKSLMKQLLSGVAYLHDNWILHRDLKTSNLLISKDGVLKICDFGMARNFSDPLGQYTPLVVTLWYRSPELLLGCNSYSTALDMWSVGCIMAELIVRDALFRGQTEIEQIDKIFKLLGVPDDISWPGYSKLKYVQKFQFLGESKSKLRERIPEKLLSNSGFELLKGLLTMDPNQRLSAKTALKSSWFKENPKPKLVIK